MLPDYIIYDELKKKREQRRDERSRVEIEHKKRSWPDPELDESEHDDQDDDTSDRGVEIIQM